MTEELAVRAYQPGDEAAVVALFEQVFGKPMTHDYWKWRYARNPTGRIIIDLAWHAGRLAGHYAVSPVALWVDGRDYLTGLSMTTMIHPAYQGRGLFGTLANSVYERMRGEAMAAAWGFPNNASHRGFIRDLGWVDVSELPTFRRVLADGMPLPAPSGAVQPLETFDVRVDDLWDRAKVTRRVLTRRDRATLTWRYGSNPERRYAVLGYANGGRLSGYAVFKRYEADVDLVDLLALDDVVGVELVLGVAQRAARAQARAINMWLNVALPLHRELEKLGFRNGEPVTYFGVRPLREDIATAVCDYRNWYLTMGDSDVY